MYVQNDLDDNIFYYLLLFMTFLKEYYIVFISPILQ